MQVLNRSGSGRRRLLISLLLPCAAAGCARAWPPRSAAEPAPEAGVEAAPWAPAGAAPGGGVDLGTPEATSLAQAAVAAAAAAGPTAASGAITGPGLAPWPAPALAPADAGMGLQRIRGVAADGRADAPALWATAQQAWAQRASEAGLRAAIADWERLQALSPQHAAAATALSRAYFFLGDVHLRAQAHIDPDPMQEAFARGILAGERATRLTCPSFAHALEGGMPLERAVAAVDIGASIPLLWYAQNLAALAVARGIPTMLLYHDTIEALQGRLTTLDASLCYAGPARLWGSFLAAAPGFAGGSVQAAGQTLAAAVQQAPAYLGNKVALAETVAVPAGDRAQFESLLREVVAADASTPETIAPEQAAAQRRAQWLLGRTELLF